MPTRVFLLRHAETANPNVFHGAESDIGLSTKGERQAHVVARLLAEKQPDVILSSTMRRARETARPIAAVCGLPLHLVPELHERRVGILSGTPSDDPHGVWPQTARRWAAGETSYTHEGAESFDDIRDRVVLAWNCLTLEHVGKTLVVVAHGVVCKVLLLSLLPGYTVADWARLGPIRNVAISELVETGGAWQQVRLNEWPDEVRRLEVAGD
jgi:2,3-bisphosphoglycerate-dependent phosphoglycerate mutase